jgi:hypothetical protein
MKRAVKTTPIGGEDERTLLLRQLAGETKTEAEACAQYGISPEALQRMRRSGAVECLRLAKDGVLVVQVIASSLEAHLRDLAEAAVDEQRREQCSARLTRDFDVPAQLGTASPL